MKHMRVPMIILAALHLAFTALTAMVGMFADGATIPERILVSLVHPAGAVLLLVALALSKPLTRGFRRSVLGVLLVGIAGDLVLAALIGQGVVKGDWSLPLVFAIVPLIGVAYLAAGATKAP